MTSWCYITSISPVKGVLPEETENNNHSHPKWTLTAMEKYMRDESDQSSIALGLVSSQQQPPPHSTTGGTTTPNNKRRPVHHHLVPALVQNGGDALESGGEESSPSWASSSAGNTPSYGSGGQAFEFGNGLRADDAFEKSSANAPLITTTTCTPKSTPENKQKSVVPLSLSTDLLHALDCSVELDLVGGGGNNKKVVNRKSRKDSQSSVKSEDSSRSGTPSKTSSKLRKLLRRTRSAGCSKDVPSSAQFAKEKPPVTKTKSADSAPCSREDGDEKLKKSSRKTLAQDMKMRLSFLRRRHTDSSLQPSVRPSPEEAHKWAESFHELTNSKYGLSLFRAFLSREFSEENIDFWLACEDYKRTRPNKLTTKARKIYDDFLAVQAPKEVNLDSSMRSVIYNNLQNPDRHSFDPAQRRIQGLMEQDAYARFLQSDLYKDLTQGNSTNISS